MTEEQLIYLLKRYTAGEIDFAEVAAACGDVPPSVLEKATAKAKADIAGIEKHDPYSVILASVTKTPAALPRTKAAVIDRRTNEPLRLPDGRQAMTLSDHEYAKCGAWLKYEAMRAGRLSRPLDAWSGEDRDLLAACFGEDKWVGQVGSQYETELPGDQARKWLKSGLPSVSQKSLISDTTSGGTYLNPEFFDTAIITYAILHSELLPYVDLRTVPRGKTVETAAVGNPTVNWNDSNDGTALNVFNTAGLVSEIEASIFPISCAVEVGRDMLEDDASMSIGRTVVENIQESMLASLDYVVAAGDGTTQPQGFLNASGGATVTSVNSPNGPVTISDLESLCFAVGKQYRRADLNPAFVCSDTTYSRARGIPTGPNDARRVFGMDHQSYKILEYPVRVNNSIPNNKAAFLCLKRYRLWRRLGQQVRFVSEGETLAKKNTELVIVRGRYAGRMVDTNALATCSTLQLP